MRLVFAFYGRRNFGIKFLQPIGKSVEATTCTRKRYYMPPQEQRIVSLRLRHTLTETLLYPKKGKEHVTLSPFTRSTQTS